MDIKRILVENKNHNKHIMEEVDAHSSPCFAQMVLVREEKG